jgi:hypothetical protein
MPDLTAPRHLLVIIGTTLAVINLVWWTAADYATYGAFIPRGLQMALFVQTAVLLLYLVLRLARRVVGEETA